MKKAVMYIKFVYYSYENITSECEPAKSPIKEVSPLFDKKQNKKGESKHQRRDKNRKYFINKTMLHRLL
jgi:hypothetical protein